MTIDLARRLADSIGSRIAGLSADEIAAALSDEEAEFLAEHLPALGDVAAIWRLMDEEWDRHGAGYSPEESAALHEFYRSPVWLLNGLFTEVDPESVRHRDAIVHKLSALNPDHVVDHGGGFGSLARKIAEHLPNTRVTLVEPFPSRLAETMARRFDNLTFASDLPEGADAIVAQDVLEHVLDPLAATANLLSALRPGGVMLTANCFQPVIKCHYPGALHFHFTFRFIAPLLGCRFEGAIAGAPHVEVYRKTAGKPRMGVARCAEAVSRIAYPALLRLRALVHASYR